MANASPSSSQKEYGYRNGQLLITATAGNGWGSPPTFTNDPLVVSQTTVQAIHLTELRDAVNQLRVHAGLSAASWAEPVTPGIFIKAAHTDELRTKLDEALVALGQASGGYSVGLAIGSPIQAIHLQELRDRVEAAWSSGSSSQINWLVSDQLGTPRMIFDQTGSLAGMKRHDYLPFGEELFRDQNGRTAAQGYTVSDTVRQKFTSKERDNETGLDYFGARYYSSIIGRFTSVDPAKIKLRHLANPQDFNRYAYVANNPLAFIDPDGEEKIKIIIRTFIPEKTVSIVGGTSAKSTLLMPRVRTFKGDDRKVGEHPERFRTEHVITIETDRSKNGGCSSCPFLSSDARPGVTREIFGDGSERRGRANVDRMNGAAIYTGSDSDHITVTATGRAADPLVAGAPDLKYDLNIGLAYDKNGNLQAAVEPTLNFPGLK